MQSLTFNKLAVGAKCLWCHVTVMPIERWNRKCENCKKKAVGAKVKVTESKAIIGSREPAAVWEDDRGNQVFVDKRGKPVKNPGYDLENDPRGWEHTGTKKKNKTII